MMLTLKHTLSYSLGAPARAVLHLLLTALSTPQQRIDAWSIDGPNISDAANFRDGFGNRAHLVTLVKPGEQIELVVTGRIETFDKSGVLGRFDYDPSPALFRRQTSLTKPNPSLTDGLSIEGGRVALLHMLMDRVHERSGIDGQTQTQGEQSQTMGGVSDPAPGVHAFVGAARALNIPARYVTGYLFEEGKASVHAWAEAWDDGLGWIGFDPFLNFCPTTGHIRLASGLDAAGTPTIRSVPPADTITQALAIEEA